LESAVGLELSLCPLILTLETQKSNLDDKEREGMVMEGEVMKEKASWLAR
jgi:hypothetical protein